MTAFCSFRGFGDVRELSQLAEAREAARYRVCYTSGLDIRKEETRGYS